MSNESTVNIQPQRAEREFTRTGFELLISVEGEESIRFPIWYENVTIGGPQVPDVDIKLEDAAIGGWHGSFHFRQGGLFFTNSESSTPVTLNEEAVSFAPLENGDTLAVSNYSILVRNLDEKLAVLESCSDPHRGRMWGVGSEPLTIGRGQEKRHNDVDLDDVTVSRAQATLKKEEDGGFILFLDTRNSPTRINGEIVTKPSELENGALLQLGEQLLRFRVNSVEKKRRELITQEATILFSDVWDYSTFAEGRPLEDTILQMNEFYAGLGKVIEHYGGVLLTFLGDAMMAVFGTEDSPNDAPLNAVRAALAMQVRLGELNATWRTQGRPSLRMGVGINTGEVMVGDVGFTGKFEFAAMGDNTNLAARVEKLTREYESNIIITESTREALGSSFFLQELGLTKVKGRVTPVRIFGVDGEVTSGEDIDDLEAWL
jgi:class 3 adenylate cyclase